MKKFAYLSVRAVAAILALFLIAALGVCAVITLGYRNGFLRPALWWGLPLTAALVGVCVWVFLSLVKPYREAVRLQKAFLDKGFPLLIQSPTNQQFVIMTPAQFEKLSEEFALSHIAYLENGNYSVRICTSWATKDEEVDRLIAMINEL